MASPAPSIVCIDLCLPLKHRVFITIKNTPAPLENTVPAGVNTIPAHPNPSYRVIPRYNRGVTPRLCPAANDASDLLIMAILILYPQAGALHDADGAPIPLVSDVSFTGGALKGRNLMS